MNEALKQFSEQLASDLKAKFSTEQTAEFIKSVKASGDDRSFEVVFSTDDEDRQGDSLDQSKWDLKYYNLNPVVLWAHNYQSFPIGIIEDIQTQGTQSIATGKFAPAGINPDADMACALYQEKILRAVSPGYIQNDDGTRELLEVSFCPVPAGRYALSLRQVGRLGVSTRDLVTKGFFYEAKTAVPYADHGTADEDTAWDGPAEVKACGDDLDKLKAICAWFDAENPDVKSSYKLPHHQASDLKAVWKGVSAAGAALQGSRGGVDIPEKELATVKAHLAKHYEAFGKTPPWEEKSTKSPQVGDTCELDDGTQGVLAEDAKNPGELVCVPEKNKSEDSDMNNELINKLKAENDRHQKSVGKAINELEKKATSDEEGATEGKSEQANDNSEYEKAIDEFKKAIDGEHADHLDKCMKAIDDSYETMGREPNKAAKKPEDGENDGDDEKAIEEFKKGFTAEHAKHVKAFHEAHGAMKEAWPDAGEDGVKDKRKKAIDEYTKAAGAELDRHEKAHMDMCKAEFGEGEEDGKSESKFYAWRAKGAVAEELKEDEELQAKYQKLDRAFDIFYAFAGAYLDETADVADFGKLLDEAVGLMKDMEAKAKGILAAKLKSGRSISAANQDKLKAIIKTLEDHHTEHGKATDDITAALKAISASGDGGEEPKTDEKSVTAPNSRSSTSGANAELETYLFTQRLVRQVKTASEGVLRQINEKIKEARTSNS